MDLLALVSFLARPKPRIPFHGLSLLRNQTETLAMQARRASELEFMQNAVAILILSSYRLGLFHALCILSSFMRVFRILHSVLRNVKR